MANYPLLSLPSLMSEGGGTGITTVAVLQFAGAGQGKMGGHKGAAMRSARPICIDLQPWTARRDAETLLAGRTDLERTKDPVNWRTGNALRAKRD